MSAAWRRARALAARARWEAGWVADIFRPIPKPMPPMFPRSTTTRKDETR